MALTKKRYKNAYDRLPVPNAEIGDRFTICVQSWDKERGTTIDSWETGTFTVTDTEGEFVFATFERDGKPEIHVKIFKGCSYPQVGNFWWIHLVEGDAFLWGVVKQMCVE